MNVSAIFPNQSSAVGNRQDLPPTPQPLVQAEWIKLRLALGQGGTLLQPTFLNQCEPGLVNLTWFCCSDSGPARPSVLKWRVIADF